ncbi:hypothetical protein [Halorubrum vacuolatum]|uniref:DUF8113 domain-containing protein n=1 Tax=Halorubrum vacuolatum TaxID=63740 RepID=A0A238UMV0_HALVU|nr:hypothetical protein [Halorubrum vacuolatum]SNR23400.1 hypothetical protein SAMN06264855_101111 [Halorubrum vacuolatum]
MPSDEETTTGADVDGDEATGTDDSFATEVAAARELLSGDDIDAIHVGVVRDGEVDTTFAQRTGDDPENEGLRALALLAAHVQLVAEEAGVSASTVAGDAATLAGQVERIPGSTDDLPDE